MIFQVIFMVSMGVLVQCTTYNPQFYGEAFSNAQASLENLRASLSSSFYHTFVTNLYSGISDFYSGRKSRGWFAPPHSGKYIFYTSCKAMCQLYLSVDNDPLNVKLLVSQNWSSISNDYTINSDKQASLSIYLKAKHSYYMEMVARTDTSSGWASIIVTTPSNVTIGPVQSSLMGSARICASSTCTATNAEKCIYLSSIDTICICENGYFLSNEQCKDIDECADGSNDCYGNQISCINTIGSYKCSCDDKCLVVVADTQGQKCMEKNTSDDSCKPSLTANFIGSLVGKSLSLELEIYFMNSYSVDAQNVIIEFFLPPFISLSSESIPLGFSRIRHLKYMNTVFSFNRSANHILNASINYDMCPLEKFTVEIPIKVTFKNLGGSSWNIFKVYQQQVEFQLRTSLKINKDPFALSESYGRSLYWDEDNFYIYACMNQHVASTALACYYSNDYGKSWAGLDVRVGSIIGRHLLTNELYAVHRNQKLYLAFHQYHKRWFILTYEEFLKNASKNINFNFWKNLEGDDNKVFTLGSKQWMGNEYGLFFRNTSNDTWLLRVKWSK